jgi:hypothetical protein
MLILGGLRKSHAVQCGIWVQTAIYEARLIIFKNPVRASKKTHFTITNITWLKLFKEIIPFYSE